MASAEDQASVARPRLLLVDDEPLLVRSLCRLLRDYEITAVGDADAAAEEFARGVFDVVLSDVNLPGDSGLSLLRRIRERDAETPVVLMTGGPTLEGAVEGMRYGALQYLYKPVDPTELRRVLTRAVHVGRLAAARRRALELLGHRTAGAGDRAGLEAIFERALRSLRMAYQPIVSWSQRKVVGYEALMRFGDPNLPGPTALFDIAEQLGRVHDVGRHVRAQVASDIHRTPPGVDVLVNLHPRDLQDEALFDPRIGLGPVAARVVLEITERAPLSEIADLRDRAARLREIGYRLAVDDLGAGYAGLTSFALLEPEVVKIDMSLVRDVRRNSTKQRLIASMASVCRDLGITVLAEGIETEDERDAVVEAGCDRLQGFLFAHPEPPFTNPVIH